MWHINGTDYLTTRSAVRHLGIARQTLYNNKGKDDWPTPVKVEGMTLYRWDDVETFRLSRKEG